MKLRQINKIKNKFNLFFSLFLYFIIVKIMIKVEKLLFQKRKRKKNIQKFFIAKRANERVMEEIGDFHSCKVYSILNICIYMYFYIISLLDYIIMPNKFAHKKVRKLYIYL